MAVKCLREADAQSTNEVSTFCMPTEIVFVRARACVYMCSKMTKSQFQNVNPNFELSAKPSFAQSS